MLRVIVANGFLQVRRTQRAIKQVLTERYYSWQEAQQVAKDDPEINLNATENEPIYNPMEYTEEEVLEENVEAEVKENDFMVEQSDKKGERATTTL
jgi:large subunit ribosomal protein L47